MTSNCAYCNTLPVNSGEGWRYSCTECVFICETCEKVTPYEAGVAEDQDCDTCWAAKNE